MALVNVDFLRDLSAKRMQAVPTAFKRYLHEHIDWRDRLIMVKGARGTGKTTLMLQRMREALPDPAKALYVSLDHLWFSDHSLYDVAEYHCLHGGTHLFIDEVHYHEGMCQGSGDLTPSKEFSRCVRGQTTSSARVSNHPTPDTRLA